MTTSLVEFCWDEASGCLQNEELIPFSLLSRCLVGGLCLRSRIKKGRGAIYQRWNNREEVLHRCLELARQILASYYGKKGDKIANGEDRTDWAKIENMTGARLEESIQSASDDVHTEPDCTQAIMGIPPPKDHKHPHRSRCSRVV